MVSKLAEVGDVGAIVGAAWGAVTFLGKFFTLVLPRKTIAWKVFNWIVSGPTPGGQS